MAGDPYFADTPYRGRSSRRFKLIWIFAGAGLVLLVLFSFARGSLAEATATLTTPFRVRPVSIIDPPSPPRVYLRAGALGPEGFGSVLQHFKHSIVFATALNSTLLLASAQPNDLRYSSSQIYNAHLSDLGLNARNACRIQDFVNHSERDNLVRGLCSDEPWAAQRIDEVSQRMAPCTSILDMEENELVQDLNGCIMAWVRDRLLGTPSLPPPLTDPPTRPITVGVHIRWGDTAPISPEVDLATLNFYGSFSLPHIARVLDDLRAYASPPYGRGIYLTIAMENHDARVLSFLGLDINDASHGYTLLDSGDHLADVRALGANDVLLLGESSYGVMAHLLAPPGLTIVEGGGLGKYTNTSGFGRHVVYLDNYTPESLELIIPPHQDEGDI